MIAELRWRAEGRAVSAPRDRASMTTRSISTSSSCRPRSTRRGGTAIDTVFKFLNTAFRTTPSTRCAPASCSAGSHRRVRPHPRRRLSASRAGAERPLCVRTYAEAGELLRASRRSRRWITVGDVLVARSRRASRQACAAAGGGAERGPTPRNEVLLVGGGGREHALAWKLSRDDESLDLIAAPGNPGIADARAVRAEADPADAAALLALAEAERLDLTIVGPEAPLGGGIVDRFREAAAADLRPDPRRGARSRRRRRSRKSS